MSSVDLTEQQAQKFRALANAIIDEVGNFIVGQKTIIRDTVVCLIAGRNVLIEGVPGLGKTELVRTLSKTLDLHFSRIQFTPDLMPADITGTNVVIDGTNNQRAFRFERGPIFANLVLADEINRATPKTQSALLEAMEEHQVTVAREAYALEQPFFVMATQNQIEMEGTYPLPEAQIDRFMFKLVVTYPSAEELSEIIHRTTGSIEPEISHIATGNDLLAMGAFARRITIAPHVARYVVDLVKATDPGDPSAPEISHRYVQYGCSPRAAQSMVLAAKIYALLDGRYNVGFEDVRASAIPSMRHRLLLNFEAEADGVTTEQILDKILMTTRRAGDEHD